jgi:hypothetical protein
MHADGLQQAFATNRLEVKRSDNDTPLRSACVSQSIQYEPHQTCDHLMRQRRNNRQIKLFRFENAFLVQPGQMPGPGAICRHTCNTLNASQNNTKPITFKNNLMFIFGDTVNNAARRMTELGKDLTPDKHSPRAECECGERCPRNTLPTLAQCESRNVNWVAFRTAGP